MKKSNVVSCIFGAFLFSASSLAWGSSRNIDCLRLLNAASTSIVDIEHLISEPVGRLEIAEITGLWSALLQASHALENKTEIRIESGDLQQFQQGLIDVYLEYQTSLLAARDSYHNAKSALWGRDSRRREFLAKIEGLREILNVLPRSKSGENVDVSSPPVRAFFGLLLLAGKNVAAKESGPGPDVVVPHMVASMMEQLGRLRSMPQLKDHGIQIHDEDVLQMNRVFIRLLAREKPHFVAQLLMDVIQSDPKNAAAVQQLVSETKDIVLIYEIKALNEAIKNQSSNRKNQAVPLGSQFGKALHLVNQVEDMVTLLSRIGKFAVLLL